MGRRLHGEGHQTRRDNATDGYRASGLGLGLHADPARDDFIGHRGRLGLRDGRRRDSRARLVDGFDYKACISVFNSAAGGLTVAAVLKYADAVLKGYATAVSVVLTGLLSMLFFGTN